MKENIKLLERGVPGFTLPAGGNLVALLSEMVSGSLIVWCGFFQ